MNNLLDQLQNPQKETYIIGAFILIVLLTQFFKNYITEYWRVFMAALSGALLLFWLWNLDQELSASLKTIISLVVFSNIAFLVRGYFAGDESQQEQE